MPIDRTAFAALVDDNGSNTTGTVWNKSQIQSVLLDPIDELFGEPGSPYSSVGTQNNINFDGAAAEKCGTVRLTNATLLTITGIANGAKGRFLWLYSAGAGQVDLDGLNGGSSSANQLLTPAWDGTTSGAGTVSLAPGSGKALLYHDGTLWRVLYHEQGAPIAFTPTIKFGGANTGIAYTLQFAGYVLRGRVVHFTGRITLSSKGSATGIATLEGLPFTNNSTYYGAITVPFYNNMSSASGMAGFISPAALNAALVAPSATVEASLTDTNFTNTSDVIFNGQYVSG